ncbi:MAG TPA: transposase [Alcaligenaceae bacterium]|nr:transposase [Alcaligenaceae bacterium]
MRIRRWTCENCHTELDRDTNASQNIRHQALADGLGLSAV